MIGSLLMAGKQEIEMEVYAGLLIIALGIAYLLVRAIQFHSTSGVVKEEVAGSPQKQLRSHRGKRKGYAGLPARGSRFNPTEKAMAMARRSSVVKIGAIQTPWGW